MDGCTRKRSCINEGSTGFLTEVCEHGMLRYCTRYKFSQRPLQSGNSLGIEIHCFLSSGLR